MKALIITLALLTSVTAQASYTLSAKELSIAKDNVASYFDGSVTKHTDKRTIVVKYKGVACIVKNVTFMKDVAGVKMIDEKTYNKLETCFE